MTIPGSPNRLTWLARLWRGLTTCAAGEAAEADVDTTDADEATGDEEIDGDFDEAGGIFNTEENPDVEAEDPPETDDPEGEQPEDEAEQPEAATDDATGDDSPFTPDEHASLLREVTVSRLERERGRYEAPAFTEFELDKIELSPTGFQAFRDALAREGDDLEAQAAAATAVVRDVLRQALPAYHQHNVAARFETGDTRTAEADLRDKALEWKQTPEGKDAFARPDMLARMKAHFDELAAKYGWRAAASIPLRDYYRMNGGRAKGGSAPAKPAKTSGTPAPKGDDKARALGAASAPRGSRPASPKARSGQDDFDKRVDEQIRRDSEPIFTIL